MTKWGIFPVIRFLLVFGAYVSHDVLVEEFQHQRNAIGENQMLRHEFELVNMIHFEVLEQQQQDSSHCLD